MKTNTSTIVLGVALVIVAGMFSANVAGLIGHQSNDGQKLATGAFMTGHVETILTDFQGNIKEYRQSDNVITNGGENCAIRLLFNRENAGWTANSNSCRGALTASWNVIALGTDDGTLLPVNGTNSGLGAETSATGLVRLAGTATFTNSTAVASTGAGTAAVATISKTFTNTSGGTIAVKESGLFNSTTVIASGMFARQSFSTINVGNGDSLTVNWTINIGSTGTFTKA
jgi:hypothetical protein